MLPWKPPSHTLLYLDVFGRRQSARDCYYILNDLLGIFYNVVVVLRKSMLVLNHLRGIICNFVVIPGNIMLVLNSLHLSFGSSSFLLLGYILKVVFALL